MAKKINHFINQYGPLCLGQNMDWQMLCALQRGSGLGLKIGASILVLSVHFKLPVPVRKPTSKKASMVSHLTSVRLLSAQEVWASS